LQSLPFVIWREPGMIDLPFSEEDESYEAPALLAEDAILFPDMQVTITVRDPRNVAAAEQAFREHNLVILVPASGLETIQGTIGTLVLLQKIIRMNEAGVQLLSKGLWRVRVQKVTDETPYVRVKFMQAGEVKTAKEPASSKMKGVLDQIDEFARLIPGIPPEIITFLKEAETPGNLADICAYSPFFTLEEKLDLLRTLDEEERLAKVSLLFEKQLKDLKNIAKARTIVDCPVCMDLADNAFDSGPDMRGKVAREFINHVVQEHMDELMTLLAGRYGPAFMRRRALK